MLPYVNCRPPMNCNPQLVIAFAAQLRLMFFTTNFILSSANGNTKTALGGNQTINLWIMRCVFYYYATATALGPWALMVNLNLERNLDYGCSFISSTWPRSVTANRRGGFLST